MLKRLEVESEKKGKRIGNIENIHEDKRTHAREPPQKMVNTRTHSQTFLALEN